MKSIGLLLLGAMAACAATSSPNVRVETDSSAVASFAAYRTFAFGLAGTPPPPFQVSGRSFEAERRMRSLVAAELVRKGYAEQAGPAHPDFVVTLASGYTDDPPFGGEAPLFEVAEKGTIVIDAFDTSRTGQVWHGTGEMEVDPKQINDQQLLQIGVERVLASFPARGSEDLPGVTSKQRP
jgi:hypothetical protein